MASSLFLIMLGANIPIPLFSLYEQKWELSPGMITLIFAVYAFAIIPTSLIAGQLSDRIGRKWILVLGLSMSILGTVSFALADGTISILLSRVLQGLSVGLFNGVAVAAMTEIHPSQDKTFCAFVSSIAMSVGNALGPIFSASIAKSFMDSISMPYVILLIFLLPCLFVLVTIDETLKEKRKEKLYLPRVPTEIRSSFYLASCTSILVWAVIGLFLTVLPTYLFTFTGTKSIIVSGLIVFLALGSSTVVQVILRKLSFSTFIVTLVGIVSALFCLTGLVLLNWFASLPLLLLCAVFAGMGHGPAFVGSLSLVNEIAPKEVRGNVISIFYAISYLGVSIPLLGLGWGAQWLGLWPAVNLFMSLVIFLLLVIIRYWMNYNQMTKPLTIMNNSAQFKK
nr:MFS transporter [Ammoniphilus sp. CFH 90114]